jgi:hypothetical protein
MSEQLDTDLVFSEIVTDAIINEITANDVVTDIVTDTSSIDLEALYATLELLSTVITPELVSSVSANEITAIEVINENTANLANKDIIGNKSNLAENAAMLIGAFQYFPEKLSSTESLVKILQYNRELFEEFQIPEEISLQLTSKTLDEFFKREEISLNPLANKEDVVVVSELVTEELIKALTKFFNDEVRTIEFVDYYAGNSRGGHDGKRTADAVSMYPTTRYNETKNGIDLFLKTIYKNVNESLHVIDNVIAAGGDAANTNKLTETKQIRDTLQIFLQNYFAEDYVDFGYVAEGYSIQG